MTSPIHRRLQSGNDANGQIQVSHRSQSSTVGPLSWPVSRGIGPHQIPTPGIHNNRDVPSEYQGVALGANAVMCSVRESFVF